MNNDEKNRIFKFIKDITGIKITKICQKNKIDTANLITNKTTLENMKKVKKEIDIKILEAYDNYVKGD